MSVRALAIGDYLRFLLGSDDVRECPRWTPDAFAVTAALLQRSGAYKVAVTDWPPKKYCEHQYDWTREATRVGDQWRQTTARDEPVPLRVAEWWHVVQKNLDVEVDCIDDLQHTELAQALIQICTTADEASNDAGTFIGTHDDFSAAAHKELAETDGRTLCRRVHFSRAVVLPKLHTPQRGLTVRSLSHYLALYLSAQIRPHWRVLPSRKELRTILILPWPLSYDATAFVESGGQPDNMPEVYGYFSYDLRKRGFGLQMARDAIEQARKQVGSIDAVVFPELALRHDDYVDLCDDTKTMIIAGVGKPAIEGRLAKNWAAVALPAFGSVLTHKQSKHHRWQLDRRQIERYDMKLDPAKLWWENIDIRERVVNFLTLNNEVTMAPLICEDMARLDPVNELLATVGPTLVISLLMDGPPEGRWPDRYASVLADDPGISVLTVTNLGMARAYSRSDAPAVALWKDAKSAHSAITMTSPNAIGVVLKLKTEQYKEWTADGRHDYEETFYLQRDGDPVEIVMS